MGRRKFSDELFPCGHPRSGLNIYVRTDDGTQKCRNCKSEKAKQYRLEHIAYFKAYRDKLRASGYREAYMKAWWKDETNLPKVRDFVK